MNQLNAVMKVLQHTASPIFVLAADQVKQTVDAEMLTSLACVVRLVPYSSRVGSLLEPGPEPPPAAAPTASWLSPTMRMTWERTLSPCSEKHMVSTDWCHVLVSSNRLLIRSQQAISKTLCCRQHAEGNCKSPHLHTQRLQHPRGNAIALPQHTQQDVLCADVVVACEGSRHLQSDV